MRSVPWASAAPGGAAGMAAGWIIDQPAGTQWFIGTTRVTKGQLLISAHGSPTSQETLPSPGIFQSDHG